MLMTDPELALRTLLTDPAIALKLFAIVIVYNQIVL